MPRSEEPRTAAEQGAWRVRFACLYGALGLFFAGSGVVYFRRYPVSAPRAAAIYVCLMLLVALGLAPGWPALRARLAERARGLRGAACCLPLFLLPYLIYAAGTGDFRWLAFAKLAGLAVAPFGLFAAAPVQKPDRLNWQDALALLWLMLPVLFGKLGGIWNAPLNLDFMARLFLIAAGAWSFLIFRGIQGSGYEFRFSRAAARDFLACFAGYAALAIPLGLALRFIAWNPQWRGPGAFLFDYATLFLFVAVAEELFFRGLLQNLLEGSLGSRYGAQAATAALFGMSHIRHAPFPNWRYVLMAALAGWFYGAAYRSRRNLMASSAVHALVDTLWRTWFTLPRI